MIRLFLSMLCSLPLVVAAQSINNTSDAFWNITPGQHTQTLLMGSQTGNSGLIPATNEISLHQNGLGNDVLIATLSGNMNRVDVSQVGNAHLAQVGLSGTSNRLTLDQKGAGNTAEMQLDGRNNQFIISQDGGDTAQIHATGLTNTRLELTQGSGNNTFVSDNLSMMKDPLIGGVSGLRIEQTGGASVQVQNGRLIGW